MKATSLLQEHVDLHMLGYLSGAKDCLSNIMLQPFVLMDVTAICGRIAFYDIFKPRFGRSERLFSQACRMVPPNENEAISAAKGRNFVVEIPSSCNDVGCCWCALVEQPSRHFHVSEVRRRASNCVKVK
jgi:hypothetical protein